jgi:site-specific recombinase XerD
VGVSDDATTLLTQWAAGIGKSGTCHCMSNSFATQLMEGRKDIRTLQEWLGHTLVSTKKP